MSSLLQVFLATSNFGEQQIPSHLPGDGSRSTKAYSRDELCRRCAPAALGSSPAAPYQPQVGMGCDRGHVFNLVQDCALYGAALLGCWLMSTLCCSLRVPLSTCLWRSVLASSYLAGLGPGVITALRWMGPSAGCCTTRLARGPCSFCGGCSSSSGQLQPELARESEAGKQLRCYRRLLPEQNISCGRSTR